MWATLPWCTWTAWVGQEQGLCQLGIPTAYTMHSIFCEVFCSLGFNFLGFNFLSKIGM